jgi:cytochrome c-type biogenesis protein CcmH
MSLRSRRFGWLLAGAVSLSAASAAVSLPAALALADEQHPEHGRKHQTGEDFATYVEGASRLDGRILAPCCWIQTIDIHGSPVSDELRAEIRRRLKAGETPDAIEASFVKRYGSRILAVPNSSPLGGVATILALAFGGVGVAGYLMLKRWSRRTDGARAKSAAAAAGPAPKRDALDDRLDRELSEIGDQA